MKRKRRKGPRIHPKYIYIFFTILVVLSFKFSDRLSGVKATVGDIMSPMQSGINKVGKAISDKMDLLHSKEDLLAENKQLKEKIDAISYDNKILAGEKVDVK